MSSRRSGAPLRRVPTITAATKSTPSPCRGHGSRRHRHEPPDDRHESAGRGERERYRFDTANVTQVSCFPAAMRCASPTRAPHPNRLSLLVVATLHIVAVTCRGGLAAVRSASRTASASVQVADQDGWRAFSAESRPGRSQWPIHLYWYSTAGRSARDMPAGCSSFDLRFTHSVVEHRTTPSRRRARDRTRCPAGSADRWLSRYGRRRRPPAVGRPAVVDLRTHDLGLDRRPRGDRLSCDTLSGLPAAPIGSVRYQSVGFSTSAGTIRLVLGGEPGVDGGVGLVADGADVKVGTRGHGRGRDRRGRDRTQNAHHDSDECCDTASSCPH